MKPHNRFLIAARLAVLAALLAAPAVRAQSVIRADGSSTLFPVTEAIAREFQLRTRGAARVTVGISGTRGGFRKFCRGETDLQDASRPILEPEMRSCREHGVQYYELPVAFDAITIVVHPRNTWMGSITLAALKRLWEPAAQGRVLRWSDLDPRWPRKRIRLFGPGEDSGTFEYFTEAVIGEPRAIRRDYVGSEDDNVLVRGIEADRYALGYVPFAYFAAHAATLKAIPVDAGAGPAAPAPENVANRTYAPLSRPLFLYVNAKSALRPEVKALVELYLTKGPAAVRAARYLPLSARAYEMARANFRNGKPGTAFGGKPSIGLDFEIEDVLARAPQL